MLEANSIKEDSASQVYIGRIIVTDQDKDDSFSCRLLNSSNDRVTLKGLILLVGKTPTDYESLKKDAKFLNILLTCMDRDGASITKWLSVPVEGMVMYISGVSHSKDKYVCRH